MIRRGIDEELRIWADRRQTTQLPESLDEFIDESNPVRVIDAFVSVEADLRQLRLVKA